MERIRVLRIVVASPGDVQAERDLLSAVVDEINRGAAADRDLRLELLRWETDAFPGFHPSGPQGLIDSILRITDCDILIGIFWKRFGTPVTDAESGTEHEFKLAYEQWKQSGRPQIMVYFNQEPYAPTSRDELEQWGQVLKFRENFPRPGLWWPYTGEAEFERLVRNHLTQFLRKTYPQGPGAERDDLPEPHGVRSSDGTFPAFITPPRPIKPDISPRRKRQLLIAAVPILSGIVLLFLYIWSKPGPTEFQELFVDKKMEQWELPPPCLGRPPCGWLVEGERLYVENQQLLGHTRNNSFGDFSMQFNLKLKNAGGATWALRVKDRNNYYLFSLVGPEGDPNLAPGFFYTYIVRNGQMEGPMIPTPFPTKIEAGSEYRVFITASGNVISHNISSVNDPSPNPQGERFAVFEDRHKYFQKGAIGFRTIGPERFSVAEIHIGPL